MGNQKKDNREIELKYVLADRLNYDDLRARLERLGGVHIGTRGQTNYFFDSDHWLDDQRSTLRLRKSERDSGVHWYFTLKGPNQYESNQKFNGRMEVEIEIDNIDAEKIIQTPEIIVNYLNEMISNHDIPDRYNNTPDINWINIGQFTNKREVWKIDDIPEFLELDHARFPQEKERYELEIEVDSSERAIAVNRWALDYLLSDSQIVTEKRGKARYFFELSGFAR